MESTSDIVKKIFTMRKPSYNKKETAESIEAEKTLNQNLKRSDIESTVNPSEDKKPIVLFVHGFASSKYNWLDPDLGNWGWVKDYLNDPEPKDYGWHVIPPPPFVAVDWSLSNKLEPISATEFMDQNNISWITYSQESAFGDIEDSVDELNNVINEIGKTFGKRDIVIIAHSRGGLISKRYLDKSDKTPVKKLVTFGSPFGGTFVSSFDIFQLPTKLVLNRVRTMRRLWDYGQTRKAESVSTRQMKPNSDFLTALEESGYRDDVNYVNVAGSSQHISNVYTWRWKLSSWKRDYRLARKKMLERRKLMKNGKLPIEWYHLPKDFFFHVYNWIMEPRLIFQILPKVGYPEMLQGDGAVSIRSALVDHERVKQYIIHRNHLDLTCCEEAYQIMKNEVKTI
ncbi:MAG: alpha/beta hydrolase [Asgard group archaeon]|nr:alpha/beta hydrolase [Asgard group archaeon]